MFVACLYKHVVCVESVRGRRSVVCCHYCSTVLFILNTGYVLTSVGSRQGINHLYCLPYSFLSSESNTVKSARTILDDIGNMFDDLADQLDAMLD